jgi:hypothetical protein
MTTPRKTTAAGYITGILMTLDNRSKRPTVELLNDIKSYAADALAILHEPDPDKQKLGFIALAIQQSTAVKFITHGKKTVTRVTILDLDLYNWAIAEVHKLAASG